MYKVEVKSITKQPSGRLLVTFENVLTKAESTEEYDTVLYATGRHADTAKLGLDAAGVQTTEWGTVDANARDETNVPGVYAIGDVATGRPELTPVAIQAGELLARRLVKGATEIMDYEKIPTTVFTPFEYGLCGLSEEDAIKKFGAENVNVYLSSFQSLELGAAHRKTHYSEDFPTNALSKLVCNGADNDRVVGFHYVGPNAGEITQGFALGILLVPPSLPLPSLPSFPLPSVLIPCRSSFGSHEERFHGPRGYPPNGRRVLLRFNCDQEVGRRVRIRWRLWRRKVRINFICIWREFGNVRT
jgi:pyruvate/2-oxoglutarate dehydrogenase complex dihydrolipoamide dehydrogenase (E3) component